MGLKISEYASTVLISIFWKIDINRIISIEDIDKRIQGALAIRVSGCKWRQLMIIIYSYTCTCKRSYKWVNVYNGTSALSKRYTAVSIVLWWYISHQLTSPSCWRRGGRHRLPNGGARTSLRRRAVGVATCSCYVIKGTWPYFLFSVIRMFCHNYPHM